MNNSKTNSQKTFDFFSFPPGEVERLPLHSSIDAAIIRIAARKLADFLGYSLIDQARISTAVFEIAYDIVSYAGQGEIVISWHEDGAGRKGLEFFCHDQGLNALELTAVLPTNGNGTKNKSNFINAKRLVDEFKVAQNPEHGNCVTIVIWKE